jgi:hypothetical protein
LKNHPAANPRGGFILSTDLSTLTRLRQGDIASDFTIAKLIYKIIGLLSV